MGQSIYWREKSVCTLFSLFIFIYVKLFYCQDFTMQHKLCIQKNDKTVFVDIKFGQLDVRLFLHYFVQAKKNILGDSLGRKHLNVLSVGEKNRVANE